MNLPPYLDKAMETRIIQSAAHGKLDALKAILIALGVDYRIIADDDAASITNPETLRRIEAYEKGRTKTEAHSLDEIKAMLRA